MRRGLSCLLLLLLLLCGCSIVIFYTKTEASSGYRDVSIDATQDHRDDPRYTSPPTRRSSSSCSPRENIFFLKTHKCASSTLQNILMRYGLKRHLSFAIPKRAYVNLAGFPHYCHSKFIHPNPKMRFNIFCHHCRFHGDNIRRFMPNATLFLSVVRNPVDVFQSGIHYFLNTTKSAVSYIDDVTCNRTQRKWYSQNPMLFDFGVDMSENRTELRRRVEARESVILMKELLCWTMDDVVYVVHNQMVTAGARNGSFNASEEAPLYAWNYGDELLYSTVNRTFWQKVQAFGHERMHSEVAHLRALCRQWESTCVLDQTTKGSIRDPQLKVYHPNALGYVLKPDKRRDESCRQLVMAEIPFTAKLFLRQGLIRASRFHLFKSCLSY